MDEAYETEWQWFRRSIRDSLVRPRRFAASLASEHYGLAGVLVALLAGIALSVSVDWLVLASKGLNPFDFSGRVLADSALLGARLTILAAVVSGAVALFMRLVRHTELSLDQAFTALTFALTPLYVTPILSAALVIAPVSLPIVGVLALALLARLLYGLFANIRPLAPLGLALAAVAIVLASVPLTLPDQVSRITFAVLGYHPGLAALLAADPATGIAIRGDGYTITIPSRWKPVSLGLVGEIGRFETDTDVLVVVRASGSALSTPDGYAENPAAISWRRGLDRASSTRAVVRIGDLIIVDDTYRGTVGGRPELLRQLTTVVGTKGMALLFRYIEPDDARAISESSSIAASWRVTGH